ncbi:MAG: hypothetical protein QW767_04475 [Thermoprotei archaeon]
MNFSSVVYTTSRSPSPRSRTLVSALAKLTPNSAKLPRGKSSLEQLLASRPERCALIVVYERWGNPAGFRVTFPTGETRSYGFDGVGIARGIKSVLGATRIGRVVPSQKAPLTRGALALKEFLESFPSSSEPGQLSLNLRSNDTKEVLSLEAKRVECVSFHFKLRA